MTPQRAQPSCRGLSAPSVPLPLSQPRLPPLCAHSNIESHPPAPSQWEGESLFFRGLPPRSPSAPCGSWLVEYLGSYALRPLRALPLTACRAPRGLCPPRPFDTAGSWLVEHLGGLPPCPHEPASRLTAHRSPLTACR